MQIRWHSLQTIPNISTVLYSHKVIFAVLFFQPYIYIYIHVCIYIYIIDFKMLYLQKCTPQKQNYIPILKLF